ncbi:Protein of unknown function [Nakamurella panacisegetis]|uniref:DUF2537 domain-containing protein n=1 Tax=Nakamurella panacisegetis TaxID=1090615 RepID=A0A1H0J452_9ACTN|nr:DUF2537 domain-containing protein [Nakamurella panacisegetis]SDO38372.1 Protein of unknown function [Nakamurella panacisegetis]
MTGPHGDPSVGPQDSAPRVLQVVTRTPDPEVNTPSDPRSGDAEPADLDEPVHAEESVDQYEPVEWAWVEEWRAGGEPVPWGPGLALSGFTLFLVASAVYVLSSGLADRPILAIAVNVLVAGGLGPALWLSRNLPVLRWIGAGAVLGLLSAWLCALVFLV